MGIRHNSFWSHLVFVSMAVLCRYQGAYKILLVSYNPVMDSLILMLIQLLLLFDLKQEKNFEQ